MDIALTSILLVLAGVGIGVLSGMLGIGGGTIIVPVLRLGYGLSAFAATATSLFSIIPISLAGLITHIRARTSIPKLGLILGVSGAITSALGVKLNSISPAWLVMVAAAIIIAYSAYTMLSKAIKMGKSLRAEDATERAQQAQPAPFIFECSPKNVAIAILMGLVAGVASGYVGVGGGFIMIPLMIAWLKVPMKRASGTSLLAIVILAIPGVIQQAMLGSIDYLAGILICVGAIPGAVLGAKLVPRIPERTLRFIFSALLGVAAIMLVVNELAFS